MPLKDMMGKKYGKLTAIKLVSLKPTKWLCECECGKSITTNQSNLESGMTRSCGCLRKQKQNTITNIYTREGSHAKVSIVSSRLGYATLSGQYKERVNINKTVVAEFIIDDSFIEKAVEYKWNYAEQHGYIYNSNSSNLSGPTYLHRLVVNNPPGMVDHINRNKMDNRANNLRLCNASQNGANRKLQKNNTSGYRGVVYEKKTGRWRAAIVKNNKRHNLGTFDTPERGCNGL